MLPEYIRKAARLAVTHHCDSQCNQASENQCHSGSLYAYGNPPQGYWDKLVALAARYGYTMIRSNLPFLLHGPGTSGFTTAYLPPEVRFENPRIKPFHVYLQQGLTPATEFLVACHELTHMLLKHPPQDARHLDRLMCSGDEPGENGFFRHEIPAHLAAIAVAKQSGVKIRKSALCYLSSLVQRHHRHPGSQETEGALKAAQVLNAALVSQAYRRAA